VFNGDTAYITQIKPQKKQKMLLLRKLGARWHYGDVLQK